jgi:hypothetical protein
MEVCQSKGSSQKCSFADHRFFFCEEAPFGSAAAQQAQTNDDALFAWSDIVYEAGRWLRTGRFRMKGHHLEEEDAAALSTIEWGRQTIQLPKFIRVPTEQTDAKERR